MDRQRIGVDVYSNTVPQDWIDINQHMNVAYFVLAFDHGVDKLWERFGINEAYIASENNSTFAVECHVTYQRELKLDEKFVVTSEILAFDAKRIHHFMRMYKAGSNELAATCEWMNLHVDLDERRVAPWPDKIVDGIRRFIDAQPGTGKPAEAGQVMRVRAPAWCLEGY